MNPSPIETISTESQRKDKKINDKRVKRRPDVFDVTSMAVTGYVIICGAMDPAAMKLCFWLANGIFRR